MDNKRELTFYGLNEALLSGDRVLVERIKFAKDVQVSQNSLIVTDASSDDDKKARKAKLECMKVITRSGCDIYLLLLDICDRLCRCESK